MNPHKDEDIQQNDLLSSTAKGASYLILLQFISRMLTFSLNQIVLRFISAETLGIASVNLELLASTILFISREGFRSALIRTSSDTDDPKDKTSHSKEQQQQQIVNLAYIPTLLGLVMTVLTCGYYLHTITDADNIKYPHYRLSVILYGVASFVELMVEPLFILALNNLYFKLRVSIEGAAVFLKCIITFGFTIYGGKNYSILAFALAQLAYGFTIMMGYVGFFLLQIRKKKMKSVTQLIPQPIQKHDGSVYYFDKMLLNLGTTMTKQSLLKHVLTEGDKMLISALSTLQDQGVYAFVVNYGSLVVRILFQPLEETGRTFFSKLHASMDNKSNNKGATTAANVLMVIIRLHILLGYIFIFFATNYTTTLIDLLGGKSWSMNSNAPLVLSVYCMYVPFMGINGITEAFVQAVATKKDLTKLSYFMIVFSFIFMTSGVCFMYIFNLGAVGLILANMVNLGVRVLYSWNYIRDYFNMYHIRLNIASWFPDRITTLCFLVSWGITHWSETTMGWYTLKQKLMHIAVGGTMFALVSVVILWREKVLIKDIQMLLKKKEQ